TSSISKFFELVSIKVSRSDRHKADCKRIIGIIVNQYGKKDPSYHFRYRLLPSYLSKVNISYPQAATIINCRICCLSRFCIKDLENNGSEELDSITEDSEPIQVIHAEKWGIYTYVDDNNCLYNSIPLVLWNHMTVFLRLAAAICGIVNHEEMFDQGIIQVIEGLMYWNDAVAWVSWTTTANISNDATMMQQPGHLVKSAIEKDLFASQSLSPALPLPRLIKCVVVLLSLPPLLLTLTTFYGFNRIFYRVRYDIVSESRVHLS
ncbi:hypothetical protein ACJMK2_008824, partial [Sinanodonta woodiana]